MNFQKLALFVRLRYVKKRLQEGETLQGQGELLLAGGMVDLLAQAHLDHLRGRGLDVGEADGDVGLLHDLREDLESPGHHAHMPGLQRGGERVDAGILDVGTRHQLQGAVHQVHFDCQEQRYFVQLGLRGSSFG